MHNIRQLRAAWRSRCGERDRSRAVKFMIPGRTEYRAQTTTLNFAVPLTRPFVSTMRACVGTPARTNFLDHSRTHDCASKNPWHESSTMND